LSKPIEVVVVRGHLATPWELRQWEDLPADRFRVRYLRSEGNKYGERPQLDEIAVKTSRDRLPKGRIFDVAAALAGERYVRAEQALAGADVIHAEELSFWFAAEAVRAKGSAKVVQTVWETIPFLHAYRSRQARRHRDAVLAGTDLFLPATERARNALRLEGVAADRMVVTPPGIDLERFRRAAQPDPPPREHVIVSPGRLVWEKGHQDVMRAIAALHKGLLGGAPQRPRLLIVGAGPEEARLRQYASELGIAAFVEFGSVPYEEMPSVFASASGLALASLPSAQGGLHPLATPRLFWEEQFGYVFAEAMAAGLEIITTDSGAIPEVVGDSATLVSPGDWMAIARALADGPLSRAPGTRVEHDAERLQRYSTAAAAERLADVYERVLSTRS
jgi:glycosyltransferase involved in cell wall biosynthesis